MEKKTFIFYASWNEAIKKMDEQQLRRFINNLCNYAEGKEVVLDGLVDEIMWTQVKPLLDNNEAKRQRRIEGGKKGGLAKASNLKDATAGYSIPSVDVDVDGRRLMEDVDVDVDGRRLKEDVDVEGRRKKDEGRGLKDDDDSRKKTVDMSIPEELVEIKNKIETLGWSSLSTKEAGYWYQHKHLLG